jgi:broad specificity phosphatase PhoE
MIVALLRHGRTEWNDARRLQGRADVPLSADGRAQVRAWCLPVDLAGAKFVASPLARATETAQLLAGVAPVIEPDLVEMDWGQWEGETFTSLRETVGAAFAAAEARGLDFRPPGGESPRDVQRRVARWFACIAGEAGPIVAVTHNGVLRALLAQLTGWPMLGKPPVRLGRDCAHLMEVAPTGAVYATAWNVPLRAQPDLTAPIAPARPPAA